MKFLVIGEICLDVFVKCKVDRLCPEAPVPCINPVSSTENYGMAGNVVANLKSLGPTHEVISITPSNTIIKTRYIDVQTGYIMIRVDQDDHVEEYKGDLSAIDSSLDGVIISDYNKGFLSCELIKKIGTICRDYNIPSFLDTKKLLGIWSSCIDFVKINKKEYDMQLKNSPEFRMYGNDIIVTDGAGGSFWPNKHFHMHVDPIAVCDVSGAGDTYLSAFALEYCRSTCDHHITKVKSAMNFANRAARIAVSKHGVVSVKAEEIL